MTLLPKSQLGFTSIVLIAVLIVAIVLSLGAFTVVKQMQSHATTATPTPASYQAVINQFLALKQKEQQDEKQVATISALTSTYPEILALITNRQYDSAGMQIASLSAQLDSIINHKNEADRLASEAAQKKALDDAAKKAAALAAAKIAQASATPGVQNQAAPASAPASGYAHLSVNTDRGTFSVDVITADLGSGKKILTDTATTGNCANDCLIFSLATYIGKNGGFAGMNGTYFCPQDYSSCAGQVNSTNYFAFNYQAKTFVNADKRDYDNAGGLFVFRQGSVQFFRDPQAFGLDTTITGAVACYPTLVAGSNIVVNEDALDDKSRTVKGNRGGLGHRGNVVYLMIAHNATVGDMAHIMQAMGIEDGINMDGGGSSALYDSGYIVGPGRNLPNAVIVAN